ncbi:ankyrin repeat-containing domain protein [Terfezia claveryi]|nr:ankyrin repeat-containing domain protein [Terfezia claveryi]
MPSLTPPTAAPVFLTEDQIDDLLYLSRTNESAELVSLLASIKSTFPPTATEADIVLSAVDPTTGNNILHMAAANGHIGILNSLIPIYLPPNSSSSHPALSHRNSCGNTPLHWACLNGHLDAVKVLVEVGRAHPGVLNVAGKDAVFEAEVAGHAEVVEWLLRTCEGLEEGLGKEEEEEEEENEGWR